jgi:PIN domain nuclease of toxin-antitoxin system
MDLQSTGVLPLKIAQILADHSSELLLSHASVWEMAIKIGLKKLTLSQRLRDSIELYQRRGNLAVIPTTLAHLYAVETLPLHHRDPFDRLLAAQCLVDGLPLLSADPVFDR